jgi:glutathione S-transferase
MPSSLILIGRQSSHYTRLVRIVAAELGVSLTLAPVFNLLSEDPAQFGGNPALKLPVLRHGDDSIYGALAICRYLETLAQASPPIVWPEHRREPLRLNAHELLAHLMAVQVEVVFHEFVAQRPPDAASRKRRQSLLNCLDWFERHLDALLATTPPGAIDILQVGLFCLLDHLPFRNPIDLSHCPRLCAFTSSFSERESARATPYRFDPPPA